MSPDAELSLPEMNDADLVEEYEARLQEKAANNEVIASCRAQIEGASARIKAGTEVDPKWLASVRNKARFAGHKDQSLGQELGTLRREIAERAHQRRLREVQETAKLRPDVSADSTVLLAQAMRLLGVVLDRLRSEEEPPT